MDAKEQRHSQRQSSSHETSELKESFDSNSMEEVASKDCEKEIKKLTKELKRAQRAAKAGESFEKELLAQRKEFDDIIDTNMVYAITDKSLNVTKVSSAFSDMFGYPEERMLNEKYSIVIHNKDYEKFYTGCEYVSTHGEEAWGIDIMMQKDGGDIVYTHTFIYPLFESKILNGFMFVSSDISTKRLLHKLQVKMMSQEKHNKTTLDFISSTSAAVLDTVSYKVSTVVKIIVSFIFLFLIYAVSFDIDEIARGNGQFIPTSQVKQIKNLEGGVVSDIYVKEGDTVKKRQILLKLSPIAYKSKLEENRIRMMELNAKKARLIAEINNLPMEKISCDGGCDKNMIENEKRYYLSNQNELSQNISKQREQLKYQESVLSDAQNKYDVLKENFKTLNEEFKAKKALEKKKIFTKYELNQLGRDLNDAKGALKSALEVIKQSKTRIQEIKNGISETKLTFNNKAALHLNETVAEILRLKQTGKNLEDIIKRTVLRSPVDGIVKEMFVHTVGSSIAPAGDIITIVPDNHEMIAKVKINPAQIAKLHVGQSVKLKVTAFDYSIYGDLEGKIINISPDTITDKVTGDKFYEIHVKTKKDYLLDNKKYKIKVGMMVNANVLVGKKTIMSFLLKPILKTTQRD